MSAPAEQLARAAPTGESGPAPSHRHLRGSSLLLLGRLIALLTNFLVQVLTVRYLAKQEYGAFSYAISVVAMGVIVSQLGLNRGVGRFVPIFHEKRDRHSMLGAMLLAFGTIVVMGAVLISLTYGLRDVLTRSVVGDALSVNLLAILIFLTPLQAMDDLFQVIMAIFAEPRAIFIRRHVLGPLLRLGAILAVVVLGGDAGMLAVGYLCGGLIGTLIYFAMTYRLLRQQGLLHWQEVKTARLPARELFRFSVPLVTSDLFFLAHTTVAVMLLESMRGTTELAEFRAVVPIAGLCMVVFQSLRPLFMPMAARLFARGDAAGLNDVYWKSAIWITVLTFPVFAACTLMAEWITVLFCGEQYTGAGVFLAILAVGNYIHVSLGLNTDTLQAYGKVPFTISINLIAAAVNLTLNVLLIWYDGARGAAFATCGALVVFNLLNHMGLVWKTDIRLLQWKFLKVYVRVCAAMGVLFLLRWSLNPPAWVMFGAIGFASFVLLRLSRRSLDLARTFPELLRIPFLGKLLGVEQRRRA